MEECLINLLDQDLRNSEGVSLYVIQREVAGPTISSKMVSLSLMKLVQDGFVLQEDAYDTQAHESYLAYRLTQEGRSYLMRDYSRLREQEVRKISVQPTLALRARDSIDDEIPF